MKILPPSLSPERAKVDDFYAARSRSIPPLPWPTIAPPLTHASAVTTALTAIRANDPGGTSSFLLYSDWLLNPLLKAVAEFPDLDAPTLTDFLRKRRPFIVMDAADRLAKAEKRSGGLVAREMYVAAIRAHLLAVAA